MLLLLFIDFFKSSINFLFSKNFKQLPRLILFPVFNLHILMHISHLWFQKITNNSYAPSCSVNILERNDSNFLLRYPRITSLKNQADLVCGG